jgi:hypothetical protein
MPAAGRKAKPATANPFSIFCPRGYIEFSAPVSWPEGCGLVSRPNPYCPNRAQRDKENGSDAHHLLAATAQTQL